MQRVFARKISTAHYAVALPPPPPTPAAALEAQQRNAQRVLRTETQLHVQTKKDLGDCENKAKLLEKQLAETNKKLVALTVRGARCLAFARCVATLFFSFSPL